MARRSKLFDYDPVTRQRGSSSPDPEERSSIASSSVRPSRPMATPADQVPEVNSLQFSEAQALSTGGVEKQGAQIESSTEAPEEHTEEWILKRGHSWSFAGLFLFTFLVYLRPYELLPSLAWLSRSALIVAVATLLVFIPMQLGLENRITARPREVKLVLALLALGLLSVPFALDRYQAWISFVDYFKVVAMFIVMVNVVRTEKRLKAMLFLVLVATWIMGIAAIGNYRAGNFIIGSERIAGFIGGLFANPNDLALHFVIFLPIIVGLALASRSLIAKGLYALSGVVVLIGIVVTFSRGGFLGLVFVIGVLIWKFLRRSRVLIGAIFVVLLLSFLALAPGAYRSRLATTKDDSATARTDELKRSVFIAIRHPLLGVGMNNYILYSNSNHASHNSYTQVAAEIGIPAAVVYVLFLIFPFRRLRLIAEKTNVGKRKPPIHYLAIALQASLIGYMVTSFFASVAYLWYIYYLVAFSICVRRIVESAPQQQVLRSPR